MEKRVSSINSVGKREQLHAKESNWTTFSNIYKNKLKNDSRPKYKTRHNKTLRGKHRQNTLT